MTDLEVFIILLEDDALSCSLIEIYGLAALIEDIKINKYITLDILNDKFR